MHVNVRNRVRILALLTAGLAAMTATGCSTAGKENNNVSADEMKKAFTTKVPEPASYAAAANAMSHPPPHPAPPTNP
jgi:hypothetical protein